MIGALYGRRGKLCGMKLQQFRYLISVFENGLNVTAASRQLHTSQPGVSRQIRLLEDELGFPIFEREGRAFVGVTPAGERVLERATSIIREAQNIRRLSADLRAPREGSLSIATTHTQARYVLPAVVQQFRGRYPQVKLHLHQGTSEQIADLTAHNRIDLAIATGGDELFGNLVRLPCFRWYRQVVVRKDHPLAGVQRLTLQQLAEYPIVTYVFSLTGRSSLLAQFESAGLELKIALTARDADVIKTYVRLGLGVGVIASMAVDPANDHDLVALDASHLFEAHTTWVGFRRGAMLRTFMYDFIELLAPQLSRRLVKEAERFDSQGQLDRLTADLDIPLRQDSSPRH
jgi:LysR family cys regulon transcriptional activator